MTFATVHQWVRIGEVMDYLRAGWLALPTLEGTHHEIWSVHMAWLCKCEPVVPGREVKNSGADGGLNNERAKAANIQEGTV